MRRRLLLAGLLASCAFGVAGQVPADSRLNRQLKTLFPTATSFSPKVPNPPHYKAYGTDAAGATTLLGVAFWTTELEPLERGYDGPVKILVGLDTHGVIAGVLVVEHKEPYGYFSVEPPAFAAQFKGKSIRDPFVVGRDIDAVSRASITMGSATRAIRNSSRRIARQLLNPADVP
jgi:transcriptional regulator of nitric oxide reductase